MASVSNLHRYRDFIRSSVQDHGKLALRWLRRGAGSSGYGVYPDGYTERQFALALNGADELSLEYFVHPEWIRQRGRVKLGFSVDGRVLSERTERDPGWKSLRSNTTGHGGHVLQVVADSAWNRRAGGLDNDVRLLGLRIPSQLASSAENGGSPPLRYPPFDGREFYSLLRMGDTVGLEFVERWERELAADTPFAERFRTYREEELSIRNRSFEIAGEYAELQRLVARFSRDGVPVVLVSTPESPLILTEYQDSPYYRSQLQFFEIWQ